MPARRPVTRLLLWTGLVVGGLLATAGGVVLRVSGLVAVAIAGAVVGCLAFGVARESEGSTRWAPIEWAWRSGVGTVAALLVISGLVVAAGGVTTALVCGGAVIAAVAVWLLHVRRRPTDAAGAAARPPAAPAADATTAGVGLTHGLAASTVTAGPARVLPPVSALPTAALGREWLRTTAVLAGRLDADTRSSVVRRRRETLDELERRDPAGFARWMAGGPAPGSDPAAYVHGDPPTGSAAA